MLAARRGQRKADFQLAMLLAEMAEGRRFVELGYSSLVNYAEQGLELTPRTTRELLSLARRLPGLPVLSASLESGELDWTKAREIVRVATPDTETAWVGRAASVTSRVLEAEIATSLVGEMPPSGEPDPERRPDRQRVVFEMDSADAEVLRTALSAIRAVTHVGDGRRAEVRGRQRVGTTAARDRGHTRRWAEIPNRGLTRLLKRRGSANDPGNPERQRAEGLESRARPSWPRRRGAPLKGGPGRPVADPRS